MTKKQDMDYKVYTAEIIQKLKTDAESFINEIRMKELARLQHNSSNNFSIKDFIPKSLLERVSEAMDEEAGFLYVISSLNKLFGVIEKDKNAQLVFESMKSLGLLKLHHNSNYSPQSNLESSNYTDTSGIGTWYLETLCKVTEGTEESERKRTDVIMKKILHEIANIA